MPDCARASDATVMATTVTHTHAPLGRFPVIIATSYQIVPQLDPHCFAVQQKRPRFPGGVSLNQEPDPLGAEQQYAGRLLFAARSLVGAYRTIEELVLIEINLKERRPHTDLSGDQRF
jgi:hypothetical protein